MKAFLKMARRAALISATTILLVGETGVGKTMMARQIHRWSRERDQPFVTVDCAALSAEVFHGMRFDDVLLTLAGGSDEDQTNPWQRGTIFLDNIADLEPGCQSHLLGFFEANDYASTARPNDSRPRIIAALNRHLPLEDSRQHLRDDLLFRISVVSLRIPALRERREDLLPMANYLLGIEAMRNHRSGVRISEQAGLAIQRYGWPGNVRELHNAIERAVVVGDGEWITEEQIVETFQANRPTSNLPASNLSASLRDIEREHIARVMASGLTVERAAKILGINYSTLWRKRKRYNLI